MSDEVQGIIKAVSRKIRSTKWGDKETTSFNIDDEWYSGGFKKWNIDKGDEIVLTYSMNGTFKNIDQATVVAKGTSTPPPKAFKGKGGYRNNGEEGGFPLHPLCYERALDRRNALTAAVNFVDPNTGAEVEDIIHVARQFEAYTTGDLDVQEVEEVEEKGD